VVIASALAQLDAGADAGGVVTTDVHASSQAADRLLILDEPTASLDLKYQFEIAAIVRRLHESAHATILLSTHDLRFAASICTRVILLSEGRLLATGRPADVLTPDLVGRLFDVPADLAAPILRAATAP
jgi:iron complex transport system ATP-binding protein